MAIMTYHDQVEVVNSMYLKGDDNKEEEKKTTDVLENKVTSNSRISHSLGSHIIQESSEKAIDYAKNSMGVFLPPTVGLLLIGAPLAGTALAYFAFVALSGVAGGLVGGVKALQQQDDCHLQPVSMEHKSLINQRFFNTPPAAIINSSESKHTLRL